MRCQKNKSKTREIKNNNETKYQKDIIKKTVVYVKKTLEGESSGHDWWHIYRVWQMAQYLAKIEKAPHLDDVILRRTMLAMLGGITHERLDELVQVLGALHNWSKKQRSAELARTLEILSKFHGIQL